MTEFTSVGNPAKDNFNIIEGWNSGSKRHVQILIPGNVNVTLSENRVFANVITLLKILR